ncbi:hypothetical protein GCK32_021218 [Trichostrongylus colubriformis]|uniref:ShKT domain-containing protein n=1 Tax=Trichostrongylus colubriformis TaxID=6319 RepID=A0AAN8ITF7_TRICO
MYVLYVICTLLLLDTVTYVAPTWGAQCVDNALKGICDALVASNMCKTKDFETMKWMRTYCLRSCKFCKYKVPYHNE